MTDDHIDAAAFHGRVVLITGGTGGIGLATARLLPGGDAHVIITGRDDARLGRAAEQLRASGGDGSRLLAVRADAASLPDLDRLTLLIRERHGRLDGVFANAGVGVFQRGDEVTEKDFDHTVDVNLKGVFFTIQKALPLLDADETLHLHRLARPPRAARPGTPSHDALRVLLAWSAPRAAVTPAESGSTPSRR
ncbi:SDR family NAD(P)-dependent oxidoreductase [Planobispora siamensis]|uniref:Ketoreductase domain-containing protein n=1 Tax=Planobispora siamensis TaxID=936338 RepID=A0A8J3SKJ3_9ACTN|nr:SDR family NAD(P)-dependent oxidoreductase [Planobispora siamensis]GIH94281.1 hypothetical protein Psi01_49110 [Planobispora siamensis]